MIFILFPLLLLEIVFSLLERLVAVNEIDIRGSMSAVSHKYTVFIYLHIIILPFIFRGFLLFPYFYTGKTNQKNKHFWTLSPSRHQKIMSIAARMLIINYRMFYFIN